MMVYAPQLRHGDERVDSFMFDVAEMPPTPVESGTEHGYGERFSRDES